jgi:2-polyprenyl-3-methyl-5-hydroxy-6-metoxy-1,4-benzoquinol methylase
MDEQLLRLQQRYNEGWRGAIEQGRAHRGNLQTNLEFLDRTGLLKPTDKILEIGCGAAGIVAELTQRGHDIIGTDLSREVIAYGLKTYGNIRLEVQAAEELSYADGTFDKILSFDLFEHIPQIDKHIEQVRRVLKPQGYYLFQTPNKYSNALFETLAHKSLKWRWAHPSLHTPGQLRKRLVRHGFDVEFIKVNPVNEFTIAKVRRWLGSVSRIFKHINFVRLPLGLQTNLYVIARKR